MVEAQARLRQRLSGRGKPTTPARERRSGDASTRLGLRRPSHRASAPSTRPIATAVTRRRQGHRRAGGAVLIGLAMLAAVGYGVSDFAGGLASRRVRPLTALLYGHPVGAVLVAALLPMFPGSFDLASVVFAALAGLAGLLGFGLMYHLMASSPLNVVSPITAVLAAATPIACGLFSGEHPRPAAWLGIAFGLVAIALISGLSSGGAARVQAKVLLQAFTSGAASGSTSCCSRMPADRQAACG